MWTWASWFPRAGPVVIGRFRFSFLLLFGKRNDLENVCILKFAPNLLKQNFLGSLSPNLHEKNIACHFKILFYRALFNP